MPTINNNRPISLLPSCFHCPPRSRPPIRIFRSKIRAPLTGDYAAAGESQRATCRAAIRRADVPARDAGRRAAPGEPAEDPGHLEEARSRRDPSEVQITVDF